MRIVQLKGFASEFSYCLHRLASLVRFKSTAVYGWHIEKMAGTIRSDSVVLE